ncbi:hypothetical protein AN634_15175 (plasmid) [Lactiplantibacillus plantarum]|uniref:hypothetical protein n=1 Tax=Lactiplantibacillus plantarum TaxID=1590 RepID=UPI0006D49FAC|nr:hypothetical protein [Lactiplantibacillus plantarum]ALG27020.1 hypothetical protein AN634_14040 [Lactiplantibacillus plantarum]ALG27329.1 hypothetical protein AN634_15175 [Lactiplantibacillus plantarum]
MAKAGTPHEIIRPNFNSGNGGNGMDNQYVTHKELKKALKHQSHIMDVHFSKLEKNINQQFEKQSQQFNQELELEIAKAKLSAIKWLIGTSLVLAGVIVSIIKYM